MTPFLIITIYVCSVCGVGSAVVIFGKHLSARANRRFDRSVKSKYIESVSTILSDEKDINLRLPNVRGKRAKMALITILSQLRQSYYGYDRRTINKLIDIYDLDRHLIRRTRWSNGKQRAIYIQLASLLAGHNGRYFGFEHYRNHRNRFVRLSALLHDIARQPEMTPQLVGNHPFRLTDLELRQIVNAVADNRLPMSMLKHFMHSDNPNLQFIGLELTQLYQPQELNDVVLGLVLRAKDSMRYKAVATAIKLHLDITNETIARTITAFNIRNRRRIYRMCVSEGYSLRSFETINRHESDFSMKQYIVNKIDSHKKHIVAHNHS